MFYPSPAPFLSMWFFALQLDMFNRTLMEFSDRQSDFGPPIPSGGVWVNYNFIHSGTAVGIKEKPALFSDL